MGSSDTMHIAERLYLRGYTTYPRTESTSFSANFDFNEIVREHCQHPEWGHIAQHMLLHGINHPKKGVDAGDHPPITPVKAATKEDLNDGEWILY